MTLNSRIFWGTAAVWIASDQVTKYWVRASLRPYKDEVPVIPDWLSIAHAQNKGAALSAMADFEHRLLVFYIFTAIATAVILWSLRNLGPNERLPAAALGTLLGGALGNFIDRLVFGQVTDMIKVFAGTEPTRSWALENFGTNVYPIFNIADIAIWVGVLALIVPWMRTKDGKDTVADDGSRPTLE